MISNKNAVSVSHVSKTFGKGPLVTALADVSFDVPSGSIVGLLGRNGAGKTTLIRILTTLLYPSSGEAYVGGYNVLKDPQHVREIIGYAGQDTERSLYYRLNPVENAQYFGWLRGLSASTSISRLRDLTDRIGMTDRLKRHFITLSGGEKQVFVVLRALLHYPSVAFLDEPSKSMDPLTAQKIRTLLRELVNEHQMTMFITSHNLAELEGLCDSLILIHNGEVKFQGKPRELKQQSMSTDAIEISGAITPLVQSEFAKLGNLIITEPGKHFRILTETPYPVIKQVVTLLETNKISAKVGMWDGNIEDAFLNIVKED